MKKNGQRSEEKKFSLKERFSYWFDNRMSKGSLGLIRVLIVVSIMLAVFIAGLIILFGFNEEGEIGSVFWDSIATVVNAWMPYFADGSPGYLVMMSLISVAGVLFTSVLIGIITSAIEEKIGNLKRGNSLVLEKDHIVVLGYYPGETALLEQLILAADDDPLCIVVAENTEREDMEQSISESLDVPKNVRIVCRTADITDPSSIAKCSVETCRTVIISPSDDLRTVKAVLAVSLLLKQLGRPEIRVNAVVSEGVYRFPQSVTVRNNILMLETNRIIAKMIAHSCTQTGLSETFTEVFNFRGTEFHICDLEGTCGMTFEDIMACMENGVPIGICRGDRIVLNPRYDEKLDGSERILVFAETAESVRLSEKRLPTEQGILLGDIDTGKDTSLMIIGCNETLPLIIKELPENVVSVSVITDNKAHEMYDVSEKAADERNISFERIKGDLRSEEFLAELSERAEHIIILNDHSDDTERSDMDIIFHLMNLRDIRERYGADFNITVEMEKEYNQRLAVNDERIDFLVASSMSSLILAQLAENPGLVDVFSEILSNKGNELYLKNVGSLGMEGIYSIRELRTDLYRRGYILLGDLDGEKNTTFNRSPDEEVTLSADDSLILLGEQ